MLQVKKNELSMELSYVVINRLITSKGDKTYPDNYFLTSMTYYGKVAIDCVSMKTYNELEQN